MLFTTACGWLPNHKGASSGCSLVKNDPCFTLFHSLVIFALDAHEKCAVYGIRAVACVTASVLTVLWCNMMWANSYVCMLGMIVDVVTRICFFAVRMIAIRKGSLVGVESIGLLTRLVSRACAVNTKFFMSRSCIERPTVGIVETSPQFRDVHRSRSKSSFLQKVQEADFVRANVCAHTVTTVILRGDFCWNPNWLVQLG